MTPDSPQQTDMTSVISPTDADSTGTVVVKNFDMTAKATKDKTRSNGKENGKENGRVKVSGTDKPSARGAGATGLKIDRYFTKAGEDVYDTVEWEMRDAVISNERGEKVFEQTGVEIPKSWTQLATNVVVSKYFRGHIGTPQREKSVRQLIGRVADTMADWGRKMDYFASETDAKAFQDELTHLLLHQKGAFNSPVWFNVGLPDNPRPQSSACFINGVDDTMESILTLAKTEGMLFKFGSGTGTNLSTIRGSREHLNGGGTASGPLSFMRGFDQFAGAIKSGGKCYKAGTLVATPNGLLSIETLNIGDLVLTHRGARPVADFIPNGVKQCYRVQTAEGYEIEVTQGHKFAFWNVNGGGYDVKPIEEFAQGDALYLLTEASEGGRTLPLIASTHNDPKNATTIVEMTFPSEFDDRLGYVVGLMYGDAELRQTNPYRVRVAFCKDDAGRVSEARFRSYCQELFGEAPLLLGEEGGCRQVGYTRKRIVEFLSANGIAKGKSHTLNFPIQLFEARKEVRAAFLAGLLDADGTYSARGGWSLSGIDRPFMVQVQRLLLSLGVPSKLKLSRPARGKWQALYRLHIVGHLFQSRLVSQILPYSAKAELRYIPSDGSDEGWGYRPSLYRELLACAEIRGGKRFVERTVGINETTGYGAIVRLASNSLHSAVAQYAEELSHCVQVTLESITPTEMAETYDIEVEDVHLLCANGFYASNTRRAAKMVILNIDHPDIEDFIQSKAKEEKKAWALIDAGYSGAFNVPGGAYDSVQFQNANHSIRVTDEYMKAVENDGDWSTRSVLGDDVVNTYKARDLMSKIAQSAWVCGDPGMQYDTTINTWHTCKNTDRIHASNPCSEYMFLNDSACNLASLNLMKFRRADGEFDPKPFAHACRIFLTAQEIIVDNASYPTPRIGENSHDYRPLGLGYANLGALLMARGVPYDSPEGFAYAGAITALMTGTAYDQSSIIARDHGWTFAGYARNRDSFLDVMRMHRDALNEIDSTLIPTDLLAAARQSWDDTVNNGEKYGYRNAQATVLAPTGCLVAGSMVVTDRGLMRLNRLGNVDGADWQDVAFRVLTDNGEKQATKFYVNGIEQTRRIGTACGYAIQGTLKHRIKVVDSVSGEWQWKRFSDVAPGDIVPLSMGTLAGSPNTVQLPPLGEEYWTGDYTTCVPRTMNVELAELIGYFMGDGSLHTKGPRFCVANADLDVAERVQYLLKSQFNLKAHLIAQPGYCEVSAHSVPLVMWWEACGFAKHLPHAEHTGKGYHAHVPNAVLATNDPAIYGAFVRGLYEADGTVTNGVPCWSSTHRDFAEEVKTLLLTLGIPTTTRICTTGWGQSNLYVTRLRNMAYNARYLSAVGFVSSRKNAKVSVNASEQTARYDYISLAPEVIAELLPAAPELANALLLTQKRHNGAITRRAAEALLAKTGDARLSHALGFYYDVVEINEDGGEQLTYDLSVPENVTYIANGFVSHNTIGFLMDCDTTGIEPDIAIVKYKSLVGGGMLKIVNNTVPEALTQLGYTDTERDEIIAYIDANDTIEGAPFLKDEHLPVFDCAFKPNNGTRSIHYMGHLRMMAAAQPFISGAISKTVNMPTEATPDEIARTYSEGWKLGLKAIAIYRDGSKRTQPLQTKKFEEEKAEVTAEIPAPVAATVSVVATPEPRRPMRHKLPDERHSITHKFSIAGHEGYITVGMYEDGTPGEIFLTMSKEGSTISGLMDSFATAISLALQYGVPLTTLVDKFSHSRFEPSGVTNNPDVRFAKSIMDYIFRWLGVKFLNKTPQAEPSLSNGETNGINSAAANLLASPVNVPNLSLTAMDKQGTISLADHERETFQNQADAPICSECGSLMVRNGACFKCLNCGSVFGCS